MFIRKNMLIQGHFLKSFTYCNNLEIKYHTKPSQSGEDFANCTTIYILVHTSGDRFWQRGTRS